MSDERGIVYAVINWHQEESLAIFSTLAKAQAFVDDQLGRELQCHLAIEAHVLDEEAKADQT